jgi:hypothetical protein
MSMKVYTYLLLAGLFFLPACSKPGITVWSAYAEMEDILSAAAEKQKLELAFFEIPGDFAPSRGFSPDMPGTKQTAADVPELIILDGTMLDAWAESGMLLDLKDFMPTADIPVYVYQGLNRALFFNGGSGALCYNRKAADKYLGHSDPSLVQRDLGDINAFIVSAYRIGVQSGGSCAVLPAVGEMVSAFEHTGKIPMQQAELAEEKRYKWFRDAAGLFHDRQWDGLEDEEGNIRELFSFFLSPLGSFAVPRASPESGDRSMAGDWVVIPGPDPQSRGGAWIALHGDLLTGKPKTLKKVQEYLDLLLQEPPK